MKFVIKILWAVLLTYQANAQTIIKIEPGITSRFGAQLAVSFPRSDLRDSADVPRSIEHFSEIRSRKDDGEMECPKREAIPISILRFKPQITTHAHHLSDLLVITDDKDHLAAIPLDSQPRVGERITKKQIFNWIKNKRNLNDYKWRGKKTAVIEQLTLTAGIDLRNKAQLALNSQLEKQEYSHVELTTKAKLKGSTLPLSAFTAQITNDYPTAKKVCVRLNSGKHSIPVWFNVKAYQEVLVAQHQIKNRTIVHEDDFILKKRNIAGLKDTPFNKLPPTVWLLKTINTNQILTQKQVTETPSVIKGQSVQVTVLNHGVSIITEAVAQKDGYIGQAIRMKNTLTNKYFVAVITAPSQAEITS